MQAPVPPAVPPGGGKDVKEIDCKNGGYDGKPFTDCDKKQICAKCDEVNQQASAGKLKRRTPTDQAEARTEGDRATKKYRTSCAAAIKEGRMGPEEVKAKMYHQCAYDEWEKGGKDPGFRNPMMDPDHSHEVQLGGAPSDESNLKWMSSGANRWMGPVLQHYNPEKHSGVKANCCD